MKLLSQLLMCGLLMSLCLTGSHSHAKEGVDKEMQEATLVAVGQAAPDFTCQTTNSIPFTLSANKGKVVVLYFFAESVPFSLTEMKYLESEIYKPLGKRSDFAILGLARGHTREETVKLGGENQVTFPQAADPKQECYKRYFTKFVPRLVVVRKNGTIAYIESGYKELTSISLLQAVLEKELAVSAP